MRYNTTTGDDSPNGKLVEGYGRKLNVDGPKGFGVASQLFAGRASGESMCILALVCDKGGCSMKVQAPCL